MSAVQVATTFETVRTPDPASRPIKIHTANVRVTYGQKEALHGVSIGIPEKAVTAFIGS